MGSKLLSYIQEVNTNTYMYNLYTLFYEGYSIVHWKKIKIIYQTYTGEETIVILHTLVKCTKLLKSLPVHPFNALIFPILRDCSQSVCIFLSLILGK